MEEDQVAGGSSSRGRSRDDAEAQLESAANPGGTQTRCGENSSPQGHGLLPWDLEGAVKRGIVGGSEGRRESISKTMLKDALSCHRVTRPDVQIILEDGTLVAMAHYGVLSAALGSEEFSDKIEVDEGGGRGGADILKLRMPHGVGAVAARGMLELLYVGLAGAECSKADGRELYLLAETFGIDWWRSWMIKEALSNARNIGTACEFAMQAKDRREDLLRACRQAAKAGMPKATEGDLASSVGSDAALFLLEALVEDGREDADVIKSGFDFFRMCWNEWKKRELCEVDASSSRRQDVVSKMLSLLDLKWLDHDYLGDVVQNSGILTSKELKTAWKARMNHLLVIKARLATGGQHPGRGEKHTQAEENAGKGKDHGDRGYNDGGIEMPMQVAPGYDQESDGASVRSQEDDGRGASDEACIVGAGGASSRRVEGCSSRGSFEAKESKKHSLPHAASSQHSSSNKRCKVPGIGSSRPTVIDLADGDGDGDGDFGGDGGDGGGRRRPRGYELVEEIDASLGKFGYGPHEIAVWQHGDGRSRRIGLVVRDNHADPADVNAFGQVFVLSGYGGSKLIHVGSKDEQGDARLNRPDSVAFTGTGDLVVTEFDKNCFKVFKPVITGQNGQVSRYVYSFKVGETGSGDGQFYSPAGIACAKWGLVVCDNGNERIHLYDRDYRFRLAFGRTGRGVGEFRRLSGVAARDDGVIAVADTGNKRVQLFDKTGKFIRSIGEHGAIKLCCPCDVAFGPDGELVVADNGGRSWYNMFVHIYSQHGELLHSFGRKAAKVKPIPKKGNLLSKQKKKNLVPTFEALDTDVDLGTGKWALKVPEHPAGPHGAAFDARGCVVIANSSWGKVQIFERSDSQ